LREPYHAFWAGPTFSHGGCRPFYVYLGDSPISSRSASFYPQPFENYVRKSTLGLAIDFPTLNVLGFTCYTISTASFRYSPTIKAQYAYRHPDAPDTTVRFNDFLFAAHGAVMCVIIYSQFFPRIWGFTVGTRQRVSRAVLGIWWACVLSLVAVVLLVKTRGEQGTNDAEGWAWIDVVCATSALLVRLLLTWTDIHSRLHQTHHRVPQVHSPSVGKLQAQVDDWLEHIPNAPGLCRRLAFFGATGHRLHT